MRRAKVLLLPVLTLAALITWWQFIATTFWPAATKDEWRRPAAWVAARLAIEGDGDALYSTQAFHDASIRLGAIPDIFEPSAPTTLLPYLPLAPLSVNAARTLWVCFSLACFVAAWALLLQVLRLPLPVTLALSAALPLFQPWSYSIYTGQAYPSAFLFTVAGALFAIRAEPGGDLTHGQRKRAGLVSGCAFAFVAIIRQFYGVVQLIPALLKRQWTVVGAAMGVFGAGALLTLALVGADAWGTSLRLAITWRERPESAVTAYQSLNNFLTHLFRYDATWNPGPVVDLPGLVGPLWWAATLIVLAISVLALWRSRVLPDSATTAQRLLPYSLATPLALLIAPASEVYHYMLTLFPLTVVAGVLLQMHRQETIKLRIAKWLPRWMAFGISAVLLGAPFRYYNVPVGPGWNALLYYPRFYGNLLLWGLIVVLLWRSPESRYVARSASRGLPSC